MCPVKRIHVFVGFEQVRLHSRGTTTGDGKWLENSDLESRGMVHAMLRKKKCAYQRHTYCAADMRICFRVCKRYVFS